MSEAPVATLDFETKSYADLRKVGAWSYSEHETTDVICVAWGIESAEIQTWWPGKYSTNACPEDLDLHIRSGGLIEAHNAAFEKAVWANVMVPRYDWPTIYPGQFRDTMAAAAYLALPMDLDRLARVLGYEQKDPEGKRLISRYSKLNLKTAKTEIPEEDFKKFVSYCVRDVMIEQSVSDFLGDLPDREMPMWLLDQRMNQRGIYLDLAGIEAATEVVEKRSLELEREFLALTGHSPTQRDRVLEWFAARGLELPDYTAETLEEALEDKELGQGEVRRAIELRLKVNKASTKKLDAMARQAARDGRARFQTRYHGALTGRNTGSGFQPLNLNRGTWEDAQGRDMKFSPEQIVGDIMHRDPAWLDMIYGDALETVAKASRHWIMAQDGYKIISGDFVSIEAVVNACLAGETWKVEAFARGEKIYERTADQIYKLPPGTVTKATHPNERQDGKVAELALGYQGALNAWLKFDSSGRHSDERIIEIVKEWRSAHPNIVALWRGLERAAIEAVRSEQETSYRSIGFEMVDDWLSMILPNQKRIWYWKPDIVMGMPNWHKPEENEDCAAGRCDCRPVPKLRYWAQKTGQWKRVYTYGGKLTENAVQATAREILKGAMLRLSERWDRELLLRKLHGPHDTCLVLSVYDEIVAEIPQDFGSKEEFEAVMREREPWFADWPISVEAWEGKRYRK